MKLKYREMGDGNPVVLIHAFPLSAEMWNLQSKMLVQNGFRVILPDLPGFGENGEPSRRYSLEEMALQLSELLDSILIEKAIICGLSMGGYVLFNLLRIAPEKLSALIFCDTTSNADTDTKRLSRLELISKIEKQGSIALVINMLPNLISDFTKLNNKNLVGELEETFMKVDPTAAINALKSMAERRDNTDILDKISVPALLIFGEFDGVTNLENAKKLKDLIPNSELTVIKHAGHYSNLEQPESFNQTLLNFCEGIKF